MNSKHPSIKATRVNSQCQRREREAVIDPKFLPHFSSLRESGDFWDFKIVAQGKEYKVHKCIISARSEVFSRMLKSGMKECSERKIVIKNCSSKSAELMIEYIYSGIVKEIPSTPKELFDLLLIADIYFLEGLKELCEDKIISLINMPNSALIYRLALTSPSEKVSKYIKQYCTKNIERIKRLDTFKAEAKDRPDIFVGLILNFNDE